MWLGCGEDVVMQRLVDRPAQIPPNLFRRIVTNILQD